MDLARQLGKDQPVYVLDDGVMLSDKPFTFKSIADVARECLPHALKIINKHGYSSASSSVSLSNRNKDNKIIIDQNDQIDKCNSTKKSLHLGGWSYGGVVSYELAKLLMNHEGNASNFAAADSNGGNDDDENIEIVVKSLLLFDAPLREASVYTHPNAVTEKRSDDNDNKNSKDDNGNSEVELKLRTDKHFASCTSLLKMYQSSVLEETNLTCPIFDYRPIEKEEKIDLKDNNNKNKINNSNSNSLDIQDQSGISTTTNSNSNSFSMNELTNGPVRTQLVVGNHWTMIMGENAIEMSKILKSDVLNLT